ncbi:MAG: hypothetical protein Q9227_006108 [Pyrenula ochraceoflavens]
MSPKRSWMYSKLSHPEPMEYSPESSNEDPLLTPWQGFKPKTLLRIFFCGALTFMFGALLGIFATLGIQHLSFKRPATITSSTITPLQQTAVTNVGTYPPPPIYDCGNSTAEAHANGCVFDRLTVSWQPVACSRAETDTWLAYAGDAAYNYYLDREGKELLTEHQLSHLGETWYWSTMREHLSHCLYLMLRFHDAAGKGERVDSIAANPHHARHCVKNVLRALERVPEWDGISTTGDIQYLKC